MSSRLFASAIGLCLVAGSFLLAVAPPSKTLPLPPEYSDYRTAAQAIQSRVSMAAPTTATSQPGYLGISVARNGDRLVVQTVDGNSPASRAGVSVGDELAAVNGKPVNDTTALGDLVRSTGPGGKLDLTVQRNGKAMVLSTTLTAISRPLTPGQRAVLGVQVEPVEKGLRITSVTAGMPAARASLEKNDILLSIDGEPLAGRQNLDALTGKQAGESVRLSVLRGDRTFEVTTLVAVERSPERSTKGGRNWDARSQRIFRKPVYRLAVVGIEYPDVKSNPKIPLSEWERALFSRDSYNDRSITGQRVYGSMNDFYREQSTGAFSVEGKAFNWVTVKRKRGEYASDSNRYALLNEALDLVRARDGKDVLDSFDGIFFLYAGERYQTTRGGLYWPHRATMRYQGKSLSYFICPEGGKTMASISVITHEFGHMLGLPDLYARPEVPGMEGVGVWCTMSVGHGRDGKPLHISAWCKEQLGWLKPVVIDPRVPQKLVLSPINRSTTECFKVLLRPDGSEYLLLENRRRIGYDRDLPGEGLLIWRIVDGKVILEESHGVAGPAGPTTFLNSVPYPSKSNNAFTPYTTPSSRSLKGGGWPVYITNIQSLPDGRIAFHIGYETL